MTDLMEKIVYLVKVCYHEEHQCW